MGPGGTTKRLCSDPRQYRRALLIRYWEVSVSALLRLTLLLWLGAGCGSRIEWIEDKERYYAVERGRVLELVQVRLRWTGNPWNPWEELLLEPCVRGNERAPDGLLCWPSGRRFLSQAFLRRIYEQGGHSSAGALLYSGKRLNREVGTFRDTWVIGIHPLAFAFLDPQPDPRGYDALTVPATWPTTAPGVEGVQTRSGAVVYVDKRVRYPKLVTSADLDEQANVILRYGDEVYPGTVYDLIPGMEYPQWRARVIILHRAMPLRELMRILVDSEALEREARYVVEIPVR